MPLPLLAAIPALLGGIGGAGGILGALGGAGGIMGMLGKLLPFGEMLSSITKKFTSGGMEDTDAKQEQAKQGGAQAKEGSADFLSRMAQGLPGIGQPLGILNLLG